jgi:chitinase
VKSRISALKESGATVRVSFGGASGKELAETCTSATALAKAYGEALDAAGSAQADFDIEGDALTDSTSVALRSKAIALLQKERSDLKVSFTLPVMPSGLDSDSLALLESANDNAVAWQGMALTSMIGVNDVSGETFSLSDAAQVRTFAEEKEVAWVSMWSTFRDQQCESGSSDDDAATDCSGVTQSAGAFGEAFAG